MLYDVIDRIKKSNNAYGVKTKKETELFLLKRAIANDFASSIDYEGEVLCNGVPKRMMVVHRPNEITARTIIAYPDTTFNRGDLIDCYGIKWLVTELDANKQVYTSGKMEQCNKEIVWQNSKTLEIVKRWAIIKKPYTSNVKSGVVISVSALEFQIQIQNDEETSVLDLGKRLMLQIIDGKPKTYSVTAVDQTTNKYDDGSAGFIIINVVQDQSNTNTDKDNVELQICDYVKPEEIDPIVPGTSSINSTNFSVRLGGGHQSFIGKLFGPNGKEVLDYSNIQFRWEIIGNNLQNNFLSVNALSGNTCNIKCGISKKDAENDMLLYSKFELVLSAIDTSGGFEYAEDRVQIEIIGLT